MSTLICAQCRRNCGNDGPTRDVKYLACSNCMIEIVNERNALFDKVKRLEAKLHVDSMLIKNLRFNLNSFDPSFKVDDE